MPTDRGYTNQRNEQGMGRMDYNARYYSPYLGRFISPDSIIPNPTDAKSFDRYAYSGNNPINYIDPSGHAQVCASGDEGGGCGSDGTSLYIYDKYHTRKAAGTITYWAGLSKTEQKALANNDWNPEVWKDAIGGPGVTKADALHDPVTYIMALYGGYGLAKASTSFIEQLFAGAEVAYAKTLDWDSFPQALADTIGGRIVPAKGSGWKVILDGAYEGRDIVVRMMDKGGIRPDPYIRVAIDGIGAITRTGEISQDRLLTHLAVDLNALSNHINEIQSMINGVLGQ